MRDIQVICVNDGSTDDSLAILQEYADRDSRVEVIDKPNGGISSARNAAYSRVKGKYTLFVDSDDWVKLDLCEKTYQKAEETNAPVILFFCIGEGRHVRVYRGISPEDKVTVKEKLSVFDYAYAWSKLWRTDFLLDNKLYFPEGFAYEDLLVHWMAVTLADKISVVPEPFYHYRRNPDSITEDERGHHRLDIIPIFDKVSRYLLESGYYAVYREKFISQKLRLWLGFYRSLPASIKQKYVTMVRESLSADDREFCRTAPKKQCKRMVKLFCAMVDGDKMGILKYHFFDFPNLLERFFQRFRRRIRSFIRKDT